MVDPQFKPDRNFAPLLATTLVLLGGVVACVGITFVAGEVRPMPIAIAVSTGVGVGLLLWLLRDRPVAAQRSWYLWVLERRSRKQRQSYELRVVHPRVEYGTNRPATLEELRAQQDATRTWVPSQARSKDAPHSPLRRQPQSPDSTDE